MEPFRQAQRVCKHKPQWRRPPFSWQSPQILPYPGNNPVLFWFCSHRAGRVGLHKAATATSPCLGVVNSPNDWPTSLETLF